MPRFPELPRHGARGGGENPRYLDADAFRDEVLPAYERAFGGHTGPFVFEFPTEWQPTPARRAEFLGRLDAFLAELPASHAYAVEIRTPAYFVRDYFDVLRRRDAAHVFNWWTRTPAAARAVGGGAAAAGEPRAGAHPGPARACPTSRRSSASSPTTVMQAPREDMRRDVVRLIRHVTEAGRGRLRSRQQPGGGMRAADDARPRARARHRDPRRPSRDLFDGGQV